LRSDFIRKKMKRPSLHEELGREPAGVSPAFFAASCACAWPKRRLCGGNHSFKRNFFDSEEMSASVAAERRSLI
jgi:hypothetical protein